VFIAIDIGCILLDVRQRACAAVAKVSPSLCSMPRAGPFADCFKILSTDSESRDFKLSSGALGTRNGAVCRELSTFKYFLAGRSVSLGSVNIQWIFFNIEYFMDHCFERLHTV